MTRAEYRRWRASVEHVIQQAIDLLDQLDGDPDLEDGADDEPSLASPVGGDSQICWSAGADDDREQPLAAAALKQGLSHFPASFWNIDARSLGGPVTRSVTLADFRA